MRNSDNAASKSPSRYTSYPRGTLAKDARPDVVEQAMRCRELNEADGIDVNSLTFASIKKVWFQCDEGHPPYQDTMAHRIANNVGCPYCSHHRVVPGETDLATLFPDIAAEWDWEQNDGAPQDYTGKSSKTVHWICPEGHRYEQKILHRTTNGCGCPYCSGHKKALGVSGLSASNPELFAMWDYSKNGDVDPVQIAARCSKKYWFRCPNEHSFYRSPANRHDARNPCPYCVKQSSSFVEQLISAFLSEVLKGEHAILERDKDTIGMELDIVVPSLGLAFEPGAWEWHKEENKQEIDREKRALCEKKGIRLVTIYDACPDRSLLPKDFRECADVVTLKEKISHRGYLPLIDVLVPLFSEYADFAPEDIDWTELGDIACKSLPARFDPKDSIESARPDLLGIYCDSNSCSAKATSIHSRRRAKWKCPHCGNVFDRQVRSVTGSKKTFCPACHKDVKRPTGE